MKYLFFILGGLALCIMAVVALFKNVARFFYNLFHKNKRRYVNPFDLMAPEKYDESESFYHS